MAIPVLINRDGGTASADPGIADKVAAAFAAAGLDAKISLIDGKDCEKRCAALVKKGAKLIVVGGGDGTISAAATALAGSKAALGIIPLGTLNHFARDLGIPADLDEAAALIATGKARGIDVAEMSGRIFINNSAIGLYPLMVLDRDLQQKRLGRSKRLAMIIASVRTLARFARQRLTLTVNDQRASIETPMLFVGNNDYRIALGGAGQRESVEDGQLCVMVMRHNSRRGLLAASLRALIGRSREDDMVRLDGVERLRVASGRRQISVSLDGEVVSAAPPLDFRIRKRALRVIAPPAPAG